VKFKWGDKGNIVVKDNLLVAIHDDGTEAPYDVLGKISELNQENATRRHEQGTVKKELDAAKADLEAYKALGAVKEIQTKLANADKNQPANEELKELRAKSAKQEAQIENLQTEVNKPEETDTKLNADIVSLSVGNAFASSKFIQEKTIFTPEVAGAVFGSHFKAERKEDGSFQVVGYSDPNDPNPKPIFSRDAKKNGAIVIWNEFTEEIVSIPCWEASP
jgi:hypothetical protein